MIEASDFCDALDGRGFDFFSGVPCSFLQGVFALLQRHERYVAAPNEGVALSVAAGAELAGRRTAVFLQNSGTGNLLDPLTSLLMAYRIPTVLFVSLRGWPDATSDEPHHEVMGASTAAVFEAVGLRPRLLRPDLADLRSALDAAERARRVRRPFVILVPGGSVGKVPVAGAADSGPRARPSSGPTPRPGSLPLRRADVVRIIRPFLSDRLVYTTTGMVSRELFGAHDAPSNFYMQGSMGHAIGLGLGTALARPDREVVVLDGDGAALMHLGGVALVGERAPENLTHVVIDNGSYESTGGQATRSKSVPWGAVAVAFGYASGVVCATEAALCAALTRARGTPGPHLVGVSIAVGGATPPRVTEAHTNPEIAARFAGVVADGIRSDADQRGGAAMAETAVHDLHLSRDEARTILRGTVVGDDYRSLAERVRGLADKPLRMGRGFSVIAGPPDLSPAEAKTLTVAVSEMLGSIMPQDFQGERVREIRDRGMDIEKSRTARYSDTRFGGHLHTDGMHRPGHIPDLFTLYCYRAARAGGDSVFIHVDDILARLADAPDVLAVLQGWFHFDTRDASGLHPRTVPRQIIEPTSDGARINYLREYIDSGHATEGVAPLTVEQSRALDAMDEVLADSTLHRFVRLAPGDLMIINNRRLVHGRTEFVDHEEPDEARLLFRTWIDAR